MGKQYLATLTWLRAIAAFLVVVSHAIRASAVRYAANDEVNLFIPADFFELGKFGVYIFFALSGCTLYLSNRDKIDGRVDIARYYLKRLMRIWPAFFVSLLIYLAFIEVFRRLYISDRSVWIADFLKDYTIANIFQYLSLTFNITGPRGLFCGPYWSLPVEFQYYLLLPFALIIMKNRIFGYCVPIIFAGLLYYIYGHPFAHFDRVELFKMGFAFFGGVFLGKCHEQFKKRIPLLFFVAIQIAIFSLAGAIGGGFIIIPEYIHFISDADNCYGLLALAAVAVALAYPNIAHENSLSRFVRRYGEASYSIYLFHMIFVGTAVLLVVNFNIYGAYKKLFFILFFSLVASYIFSRYSYRYIEAPAISLGRRMALNVSISKRYI